MRLGVDLGGTKTEIMALDRSGTVALRRRVETPKDYNALLQMLSGLISAAEAELGMRGSIRVD